MAPLTNLLELPQSCIQQVEVTPHLITLTLSMKTTEAPCPLCERPSRRVHRRYQRTLQDLACGGKTLRLLVQVRRFWCHNAACARKIFAERLPELTGVYARRTTRCTAVLTELSFALGGRPGARLSAGLGIPGNRMTLLRILRRTPVPAVCTPRILGVDEWAYRRGKTYHAPHNLAKGEEGLGLGGWGQVQHERRPGPARGQSRPALPERARWPGGCPIPGGRAGFSRSP